MFGTQQLPERHRRITPGSLHLGPLHGVKRVPAPLPGLKIDLGGMNYLFTMSFRF